MTYTNKHDENGLRISQNRLQKHTVLVFIFPAVVFADDEMETAPSGSYIIVCRFKGKQG